ncbi:Proton/glutamate symport protein [Serinicoccus hydrothermalis]|uniref:Proton/glutamate symport protein n=1 Tax=Serinicoccus hydrothermalis TaxID=1758689 RepID=A0A1B1NFU4_9MICO|nr:dicarboxylate/amino acid:cation symporter [Serinicoccus hydrothermalis]ANS80294.1 Proton/glutamate symport protein [Serinicoccus hydrothermalis]
MASTTESQAPQKPSRKRMSLTTQITIALVAGAVVGSLLNTVADIGWVTDHVIEGILSLVADGFVRLLQMLVVPLVVFSLITGVAGIGDIKLLGRVGGKAFALYVGTTALAITTAILLALLIGPGRGFDMSGVDTSGMEGAATDETFWQTLASIIPGNPIAAFAEGDMLQIIFYVIIVGIAALMLGERSEGFLRACEYMNELMMKVVTIVMMFAPIGVFALLARAFAREGYDLFVPLASYVVTLVGALFFHLFVTILVLFWLFTRLSPMMFLRKMRAVQLFAFSTASSNATIPVTMRAVNQRMGVDRGVASFTVPFGATINMDGTAIMQGVATVFIANVYGIDLGLGGYLTVIGMAVLASIGTAGVPGVGLIMLTMVLNQVGLPVEGIAIIIGVDRLMDMIRTAVNVTGDAMVSTAVAKSEGEMDVEVFNDPAAGEFDVSDIDFDDLDHDGVPDAQERVERAHS